MRGPIHDIVIIDAVGNNAGMQGPMIVQQQQPVMVAQQPYQNVNEMSVRSNQQQMWYLQSLNLSYKISISKAKYSWNIIWDILEKMLLIKMVE